MTSFQKKKKKAQTINLTEIPSQEERKKKGPPESFWAFHERSLLSSFLQYHFCVKRGGKSIRTLKRPVFLQNTNWGLNGIKHHQTATKTNGIRGRDGPQALADKGRQGQNARDKPGVDFSRSVTVTD